MNLLQLLIALGDLGCEDIAKYQNADGYWHLTFNGWMPKTAPKKIRRAINKNAMLLLQMVKPLPAGVQIT